MAVTWRPANTVAPRPRRPPNSFDFAGSIDAYDPATNQWTTQYPGLPTPRSGLGVGVVNDVLYAVGGSSVNGYESTVEAYDPASHTWTTKGADAHGPLVARGGVVNGRLYAVDGWNGERTLPTVEMYDPGSDTWSTKAPLPTPRATLAAGMVNGTLYLVGGEDRPDNMVGTVEAYVP
jgi:N-acetylneuraminic acid mutarotase